MKSLGCDADALGVLFMPPRGAPDLGAVLIAHDLGRRQAGLVLGRWLSRHAPSWRSRSAPE